MSNAETPKVYLAGPLGFTEAGRAFHNDVLVPKVRAARFEPLDPWDLPSEMLEVFELAKGHPDRTRRLAATNRDVGARNAQMIRDCAGVLAVLDGTDVDSGTAAEIGFAAALGKPVIGVRLDLRITGDNEATLVNLQVEWFIENSGGRLTTDLDDAIAAVVTLLHPAPGT